jgi:hypothetical protein
MLSQAVIDRAARDQLAVGLSSLVNGEMTNDEFDDEYYGHWEKSDDAAVAEIARFGWSLYSSDVTTYRLRGWHAVRDEVRQGAQRALL